MTSSLCAGTIFCSLPAGQQSSPSVAAAMREGKHLQRSWFSLAGPCTCVSGEPEPQHKAQPSYPVEIEQKHSKAYFANSPSESWHLASEVFSSPRPSQLPWDFHLLITEVLKTWILTTVYQTCPLSSLFKACHYTVKPRDPTYTCLQPSSCSQAPGST